MKYDNHDELKRILLDVAKEVNDAISALELRLDEQQDQINKLEQTVYGCQS